MADPIVFEDIFEIAQKDPDGKKFDKGGYRRQRSRIDRPLCAAGAVPLQPSCVSAPRMGCDASPPSPSHAVPLPAPQCSVTVCGTKRVL